MTMETKNTSFSTLINGDKPVVVDFFAEWCGPCKMMKPILDEFKGMVGDRATVIKIDVDKNPVAAQAYGVRGVPTLAIFKKGEIVWRKSGVISAAQLQGVLKPFL
jgi:thioredoxin 1